MNEPCKEGKCITYILCKQKKEIDCPILSQYISHYRECNEIPSNPPINSFIREEYFSELWFHIKEFFPYMTVLNLDETSFLFKSFVNGRDILYYKQMESYRKRKQ